MKSLRISMKPPWVYTRGVIHFFGVIRRSTRLRFASFGWSTLRIHPWGYAHGLLRRRIKTRVAFSLRDTLPLIRDWRFFVPGLLTVGFIVGMLSIQASAPTASVHQGPYAFVGLYKGEIYELIPMEEAVRLRQLERQKAKPPVNKIRPVHKDRVDFLLDTDNDRKPLNILRN